MIGTDTVNSRIIYWHRESPPLEVEPLGEHTIEATSGHVPGTLAHRDELWARCYEGRWLKLGADWSRKCCVLVGSCAHVLSESVDSKHDELTGEAWLHAGTFTYVLYRVRAN